MTLDIAVISVIISGMVAVGALIVTPIIAFINEWFKWRRESKQAKTDRFLHLTNELLGYLARLELEELTYRKVIKKVHGEMLQHYYMWELALASGLKHKERESLLSLRDLVENPSQDFHETAAEIVDKVLSLSAAYIRNVQ